MGDTSLSEYPRFADARGLECVVDEGEMLVLPSLCWHQVTAEEPSVMVNWFAQTTVAQILMQLIDHQRSLREAITAPRVHHQWLPDLIVHEPGIPTATLRELEQLGHHLLLEPVIGHANCIEVSPDSGVLQAIVDSEGSGGGASAY